MNVWQVETITATGEVVHGFSIVAPDSETARIKYMAQPERPQLVNGLEVRVSR